MLKKTCLIFVFLTLQTTFYGFNADFSTSSEAGITLEEKMEARYVISPYDHVIRNISEREGNDWRLMSAIAYHESRFTADIVSRRGARGLMQIMPAVARQFDVVSEEALLDPEIFAGVHARHADGSVVLRYLAVGAVINLIGDNALPHTDLERIIGDTESNFETSFILLAQRSQPHVVVRE